MEFIEYDDPFPQLYVVLAGVEVNAHDLLEFVESLEDASKTYPMRYPETKEDAVDACAREGVLAKTHEGIYCMNESRRQEIVSKINDALES